MTDRHVEFVLTERDVRAAAVEHAAVRLLRWQMIAGYSAFGAFLMGALLVNVAGRELWRIVSVELILLGGMIFLPLLLIYWTLPRVALRHFRQAAGLRSKITLCWDESGVAMSNEQGNSSHRWRDFFAFYAGRTVLILYMSEQMYWAIPRVALSGHQGADLISCTEKAAVRQIGRRRLR